VRFAFEAEREDFEVSEESLDLAWVQIANLEAYTDEVSMLRMAEKWLERYQK
jgi:hypothetical protein